VKRRFLVYLIASQATLIGTLLVCIAVSPTAFFRNYPLSYYGTTWPTAVPYVVGFVLAAGLLYQTARTLPHGAQNRTLRRFLWALSGLLLALVATPYKWSPAVGNAHLALAILLLLLQLSMSVWLIRRVGRNLLDYALLGVVVLASVFCIVSIGPSLRVMAMSEFVLIVAFSLLLTRWVRNIEP
jgi:hypothetical protein